jgi:hypothetical protein
MLANHSSTSSSVKSPRSLRSSFVPNMTPLSPVNDYEIAAVRSNVAFTVFVVVKVTNYKPETFRLAVATA